jgi:hypothetical protein
MTSLPIDDILPELCASLEHTPNAVVKASPGAGKTTRIPLRLLDAPWREGGRIIILEPRRLAARAAARRMAQTLGEPVGKTVGYRVQLDNRTGPDTLIEVVTEGILTRRLQRDPSLEGVAAVIFDEFHERSLQADLGLALCLDCQAGLREDLRIVVMSATLDMSPVAELMGSAPVIESPGRAFPVETFYLGKPPIDRFQGHSLPGRVCRRRKSFGRRNRQYPCFPAGRRRNQAGRGAAERYAATRRGRGIAPLRRTSPGPAGSGHIPVPCRAAESCPCDSHRRDQPDHRRDPVGGRCRSIPDPPVRSPKRHDASVHGTGFTGKR